MLGYELVLYPRSCVLELCPLLMFVLVYGRGILAFARSQESIGKRDGHKASNCKDEVRKKLALFLR